jgi:glycosyltransferase involved in cell wall biosynthesis
MRSLYKYDVSVIIPTYNRSELLGYSLESLVNQTIGKDRYEVIVGDDGSLDDTSEVVKTYSQLMNMKYVFQEDKGYRPGSVRNKAIRLAEGKVCLFVDSSVLLHPDCIAQHVLFHSRGMLPMCGIGYVYGFDHDLASDELLKKLIIPANVGASIEAISKYKNLGDVREPHYVKYKDDIGSLPAPWYYFWTCHVSVATADLIRNGMFDENYDGRWGVEDTDLGFRLHKSGVNFGLLRSAMAIHYPHGKDKSEKILEGYINSQYFHKKNNTLETALFQSLFEDPEATGLQDINEMIVQANKSTSIEVASPLGSPARRYGDSI